jgi:Xaa-Pro aminopeptidase
MTTRKDLAVYERRLSQVRSQLGEWQVGAILVTGDSNRRWLSGFTGSAGQLLVTREDAFLATDFRYWEQAVAQAPAFQLFKHRRRKQDAVDFFSLAGTGRIGIEASNMTVAESARLDKDLGIEWVALDSSLEPMRAIKDKSELESIAAAAAIADQAMGRMKWLARPGMSERALAWELEKAMREAGAHGLAFEPIVASGPNSALPHHRPGERVIQAGDVIIVDMGAEIDGYRSDLTRSFFLGDQPSERFWEIYNLVAKAQSAALTMAAVGMSAQEVDALARGVINDAGYGEAFGHGLGHGIGLDVHEGPLLSSRPEAKEVTISPGMVVTIEPGIYLSGWGGVRIEDLVCCNESGMKSLSQCPKEPIIPLLVDA